MKKVKKECVRGAGGGDDIHEVSGKEEGVLGVGEH